MLIDLLSTANYNMYNVSVANKIGLHASIYLSEIMNINDKAIRKNKVEDNYFTIDREYVEKRTTLKKEEQIDIDKLLLELNILEKSNSNDCKVRLNVSVLASLLMSDDEELLKDVNKILKKNKSSKTNKLTKAESIAKNLKLNIVTENIELRNAYFAWIDSVIAKDGWMVKTAVMSAQNAIDTFSQRNLDVALKVLEIATINGYRDMSWAINKYKSDNRNIKQNFVNPTVPVNNSKPAVPLSYDEVF